MFQCWNGAGRSDGAQKSRNHKAEERELSLREKKHKEDFCAARQKIIIVIAINDFPRQIAH